MKSKGGRPRQTPQYHEGKQAQRNFSDALKAVLSVKKKPATKRAA